MPQSSGVVFVLSGGGLGHGVGMSQFGAEGFAEHGYGFERILAHYYPGTRLGRVRDLDVRVLLADGQRRAVVTCTRPCRVRGRTGGRAVLPPGRYPVGGGLTVRLAGRRRLFGLPVRFDPGASPLRFDGRAFRGSLRMLPGAGGLQVVNSVPLERYLRGVVPAEMPWRWQAQALEAQAVAARSYAVAKLKPTAAFDLYADTRDQMYGGVEVERASTNRAVGGTAGTVLTWDGQVALAYYSASSGGRTETNADAWPGSRPLPYLASVSDPYDTLSPYHRWKPRVYSATALARRLGLANLLDLRTIAAPSGWAIGVSVTTTAGERSLSAGEFAGRLGLGSTFFDVGVLGLRPERLQTVFGHSLLLQGLARDLHPVLQSRQQDGEWRSSPPLTVPPDGSIDIRVDPVRTTSYRLATPAAVTAPVTIAVTPEITIQSSAQAIRGRLHPGVPDLPVTLERQIGGNWLGIRSTHAAVDGSFRFQPLHVHGLYRIRTPPTSRLLSGTTGSFAFPGGR